MMDTQYSFPIHSDYGIGLKFKTPAGEDIISRVDIDKHGYRELLLRINIWPGGDHYYGSIESNIKYSPPSNLNQIWGGYATKNVPKEYKEIDIPIYREVTEQDFEYFKNTDRMFGYDIGDAFNGFFSEDELVAAADNVMKHYFKGKWSLRILTYNDGTIKKVYNNG